MIPYSGTKEVPTVLKCCLMLDSFNIDKDWKACSSIRSSSQALIRRYKSNMGKRGKPIWLCDLAVWHCEQVENSERD